MASRIYLTNDQIDELREEINGLDGFRCLSGAFSVGANLTVKSEIANLIFTPQAWLKLWGLVDKFETEIGWYGVVEKREHGEYFVSDILCPPQQKVSGAKVDLDYDKQLEWEMSVPTEKFNNVKLHGHSHVNMGVTPSSTDETFYSSVLSQVRDESFYIFIVANKKREMTIKIVDFEDNILYINKGKTNDIVVDVFLSDEEGTLDDFQFAASKSVIKKTYTQTPYSSYYQPKVVSIGSYKDKAKNKNHASTKTTTGKKEPSPEDQMDSFLNIYDDYCNGKITKEEYYRKLNDLGGF